MPLTRKSIATELAVKVIAENKATQQKLAKELRAREAVIACCWMSVYIGYQWISSVLMLAFFAKVAAVLLDQMIFLIFVAVLDCIIPTHWLSNPREHSFGIF